MKAGRTTVKTVSNSFPCTPVPSNWSSARRANTAKLNSVLRLREALLGAEEFHTWRTGWWGRYRNSRPVAFEERGCRQC